MEGKESEVLLNNNTHSNLTLLVPSKKIQINSIDQEEAKGLKVEEDQYEKVAAIRIEGNSYSLDFCKAFGDLLKKTKNIKVAALSLRTSISMTLSSPG